MIETCLHKRAELCKMQLTICFLRVYMKNKIQVLIENMVKDLEEVISNRYPSKDVKVINVEVRDGIAQLSFSVSKETSLTIDVHVN